MEFPAHHASVDRNPVGLLHSVAQLFQGDIRLPGDFGPQPRRIRRQTTGSAAGMGQGRTTAGFPQAAAQPFHKGPAHAKPLGDGPLRELAGLQGGGDPFT